MLQQADYIHRLKYDDYRTGGEHIGHAFDVEPYSYLTMRDE
jgi:hypothetical protein